MFDRLGYLLLQVRNADDPMRGHEVRSFARVLRCPPERIRVFDLLGGELSAADLAGADMLLLGGSGHYSAAGDGAWLERALESLRRVHASGKPTFASCWGFQALARAMGGRVVHDPQRGEIGTHALFLTPAGQADPVFGPLGQVFHGQMGHQDCVVELPPRTTLLAFSQLVEHQAYRFEDAPIYCTQFHPELSGEDLLIRLSVYPEYMQRITGRPLDEFPSMVRDTRPTEALLQRFVAEVFA